MSIWSPSNKYEADLMVKIEATTFELRRNEMDLLRIKDELWNVENQLTTYESCLRLLRSKEARIVILKEYGMMRAAIPELNGKKTLLNTQLAQTQQAIRGMETLLGGYKRDIERSRFKILEFKRERP